MVVPWRPVAELGPAARPEDSQAFLEKLFEFRNGASLQQHVPVGALVSFLARLGLDGVPKKRISSAMAFP